MADEEAPNSLNPGVRNRSVAEGDVPDNLRRRYYVDGRGGAGLGFYADAKIKAPTFRDRGRQLVASRSDPNAIRDMTAIAKHRGWSIVVARGDANFRREAWLAGRSAGIEVRGYRPTERDIQELDRRIDRKLAVEARSGRSREGERSGGTAGGVKAHEPADDAGARSRLRIVESVVRARIVEPSTQERVLAAARERIAGWLERGATFEPVGADRRPVDRAVRKERQR